MLEQIRLELKRLNATEVLVELDPEFEPETGTLVKVTYDGAFWHLLPGKLEELTAELPDSVGGDAIKQAIEAKAHAVWRGHSPGGSRDEAG